jgi:hypothetical protein
MEEKAQKRVRGYSGYGHLQKLCFLIFSNRYHPLPGQSNSFPVLLSFFFHLFRLLDGSFALQEVLYSNT